MKTYKEFYTLIEQRIAAFSFDGNPPELYNPLAYMLSLGGKRLRPVLVLMANDIFGGDTEKAVSAALAVEVFHNFTLVHDDIMDKADIRRGMPTVHKKWNETVGILSGDLMMIKATQLLCETDTSRLKDLLGIFNTTAVEVCEGQQIDMNFESRSDVSVDEYIQMITLKTAVLLGGSLKLGALVADASLENANHMYDFGKNIGIAFQIQDDLLDSFGEGDKIGKKIGGDIAANKKTLLLINAFEKADTLTRQEMEQLMHNTTVTEQQKIDGILAIYNKLNVKDEANKLKEEYLKRAFAHLEKVEVEIDRKEVLKNTALDLMERMS
ncbi:MAG TPA: isoprenyl synthetase [Bacteroidetes bacterium]|jgi:geranylgeranyl diphosphate synthase type II|nr:isoprenyl synthetase [Bacteroidota bacterium]